MTGAPEVFRDTKAILGESLVWDRARGAMLWCDITAGLLHVSSLDGPVDGSADATIRMPTPLASFHLADNGGFVMSLGSRVVLTDSEGHVTTELVTIEHARDGMRLNEGKVDPAGRWVTGSMILVGDDPVGAFYRVTPGGATVLRGGLGVSNGLEWSLDGTRVFFTDTSVASIYTGTYTDEGDILDVETWHHGTPNDGLAIDVDGCLWSGLYGGGCVVRYDPTGTELERIELPAPNVTSVAFAGSTLFVATARENLTEQQLEDNPLSGAVFTIETSTSGVEPRSFAHRS
jgi:sugar lactone lactonase YvrE